MSLARHFAGRAAAVLHANNSQRHFARPQLNPHDDLPMWAIFDGLRDCPGFFVVRRSVVHRPGRGPIFTMDRHCRLAVTLTEARLYVPPGLFCQPRCPADPPFLVETWF